MQPRQRDGRRVGRTHNVVTLEVSQLVSGWLKAIAPLKVACDAGVHRHTMQAVGFQSTAVGSYALCQQLAARWQAEQGYRSV
jgi:hypothetical protein